jgi:hypothetical protein
MKITLKKLNHNNMKKAFLVSIQVTTRVVVDEDATDESILAAAGPRLQHALSDDYSTLLNENTTIEDDVEVPYDPETDGE